MSDGKKAAAEEAEQVAIEKHLQKLRKIGYVEIRHNIEVASGAIRRLQSSDPALTRGQHAELDLAVRILTEML